MTDNGPGLAANTPVLYPQHLVVVNGAAKSQQLALMIMPPVCTM